MALEIISIVISLISAIVVAIMGFRWDKKLNRTNLQAEYYKEIYGKHLMSKIPMARNSLYYNGKEIEGIDDLVEIIRQIRHSSLYFKYSNKKFYDSLFKHLQSLEDILIKSNNLNNDEYHETYGKMEKGLEELYKCINKNYIG